MRDIEKIALVTELTREVTRVAKTYGVNNSEKVSKIIGLPEWSKLNDTPSLKSQLIVLCISTVKSPTLSEELLEGLKTKLSCVILHDVHDEERKILNKLDYSMQFINENFVRTPSLSDSFHCLHTGHKRSRDHIENCVNKDLFSSRKQKLFKISKVVEGQSQHNSGCSNESVRVEFGQKLNIVDTK